MAYVITQNCCKDASCIPVCPVDCIRPAVGEALASAQMLYIDPDNCIDCGACVDACPVNAIHYDEDLPPNQLRFKEINAAYFERHPLEAGGPWVDTAHQPVEAGSLRVAVVGAGPAACYAAEKLIDVEGVEVNLFERLPTPFGLIRAGVAPDHQATKLVADLFGRVLASPRSRCYFNVDVGQHISHLELMEHHHAVIYAVGASEGKSLHVEGEELPGVYSAAEFVGWYNGHPDHARSRFDLSSERAVVIGNGNVALDVARVLLTDTACLANTDIAQHALDALGESVVREVVVLGRRGPRDAAFSVGELVALAHLDDLDVVIDAAAADLEPHDGDDIETTIKLELCRELRQRTYEPGRNRVVFQFNTRPCELAGEGKVRKLRVLRDGVESDIDTGLVLTSIGYLGRPIDGLDYDVAGGIVPNDGGRVLDDEGDVSPAVYVTGWIKRGPRGVIGSNRVCAEETVMALLEDFDAGKLTAEPPSERGALSELLRQRGCSPIDWDGWLQIDAAERESGARHSRPRTKFVAVEEMLGLTGSARDH